MYLWFEIVTNFIYCDAYGNNDTKVQFQVNHAMSESTMEALDAIDDAIDEALDDDLSPTPPKRQCSRGNAVSAEGNFKKYYLYLIFESFIVII